MRGLLGLFLFVLASILQCLSVLSEECGKKEEMYIDSDRPTSCKEILARYPATPSGYYWIQSSDAFINHKVYCDMDTEHCGSKGWTRVAYTDMSNSSHSCPGDLTLINSPIRTCGGLVSGGCASAKFLTYGIHYSQVCGRLKGYQVGTPDAFTPTPIDGVLISHGYGKLQKHIWAYVSGYEKIPTHAISAGWNRAYCPCADQRFEGNVPVFMRNDYYCDSGVNSNPDIGVFYTTPLWSGQDCTQPYNCCSDSGMPWFCKHLPVATNDNIELLNCHNQPSSDEDTALELIELYIR